MSTVSYPHTNNKHAIDMNELLAARRRITRRKHNVYQSVLALCHRRIRYNAQHRTDCTWCLYKIPTFVPGLPRFDLNECTRYCLAKLKQNGFDITFIPPQTMKISWRRYEQQARRRAKTLRKVRISGLYHGKTSIRRRKPTKSYLEADPPRQSLRMPPPRPPAFEY